MKVEIWSDVVCPWCYIGKRRFEAALGAFAHRGDVEVVWRSFELDPYAPAVREGDATDRLARKYGMTRLQAEAAYAHMTEVAKGEDLDFRFDIARPGSTFDAHRVLHMAAAKGLQDAVKERLLSAYFTEGLPIGDAETLVGLGAEAGLDAAEVQAVLAGDRYAEDVRADEQEASDLGISGVPFFVVGRKYALSGAQSPEVLLDVLERAWVRVDPLTRTATGAATCEGDACVV